MPMPVGFGCGRKTIVVAHDFMKGMRFATLAYVIYRARSQMRTLVLYMDYVVGAFSPNHQYNAMFVL